jgi:hypothetical protein
MSSPLSDLISADAWRCPGCGGDVARRHLWMFASPANAGTFMALPIDVSALPVSPWHLAHWAL